jgi:hypothetical protein
VSGVVSGGGGGGEEEEEEEEEEEAASAGKERLPVKVPAHVEDPFLAQDGITVAMTAKSSNAKPHSPNAVPVTESRGQTHS